MIRREDDRIECSDTAEDLKAGPIILTQDPPFYKRPAYWVAQWLFIIVATIIVPYSLVHRGSRRMGLEPLPGDDCISPGRQAHRRAHRARRSLRRCVQIS